MELILKTIGVGVVLAVLLAAANVANPPAAWDYRRYRRNADRKLREMARPEFMRRREEYQALVRQQREWIR